jgi:PEP-CTERM motif-containing protein
MKTRGIARALIVAGAAVTLGALPALAQTVTFSTTGAFSGGGCTTASCAFDGFTLSFTPVGSNTFFSGSLIDLGSFNTQCVSCTNGVIQNFPSGVVFTLTINQTNPSSGSGNFSGSVSGSLSYNPAFGNLIWMPTSNSLNIGAVNYQLVIDNTGNFNIEAPTPDANPNPTVVKAFVTTTPEPSTVALMATGLLGLIPVMRRRRKQ